MFLLNSCFLFRKPKPTEELQCQMPSVGYVNTNKLDKLQIEINVDGSGSMIGYVNVDNSNYIQVLEALANLIEAGSTTQVEYRRIGDKVISRDDFRRDAKSRAFYDGSGKYPKVSSPIQNAIEKPETNTDKLTVIVTDLEGDDGNLISQRLKEYYFNKKLRDQGYTVGVWAVKSQFNGTVFDPKTGKVKFNYNTAEIQGKNKENYRPFYVLFIGKYAEIANYFDNIKKSFYPLVNESEMFIFPANNIVKQAINLDTLKNREQTVELPDNNQLQRLLALADENVIVKTENDNEPYELLQIVHEEKNPIEVKYKVPFSLITDKDEGGIYALDVDNNNLKLKTKVFTYSQNQSNSNNIQQAQIQPKNENQDTENKQPKPNNSQNLGKKQFFAENSNVTLQNALTIENLALTNNNQTLEFTTNINIDNLSDSQINLFEVDLILDDLKDLDWWQKWDSRNANNKDGSKTENISLFMNKLEQLSLDSIRDENNNPVIGRLCFAIHKN